MNVYEMQKIFKKYPSIVIAYIFGSGAKNKIRKESDVDVAVLLTITEGLNKNEIFNLKLDLMADLERYFKRKTEVIILNDAPILLKHEVVAGGKLLYAIDEDKKLEFESICRRSYFDFKYMLYIHTMNFLNCLKEKNLDECTRGNRYKT